MGTSNILGGWTPYSSNISAEAYSVFEKAVDLRGVNYTPVAVATQPVSGTNYSFFCNAKGVYPNATNEAALITVYQPLKGEPHIMKLTPIKH